ncbi:MAG: MarR family winged helix-turn-helix transcriptional regulator [Lautropia sp.]
MDRSPFRPLDRTYSYRFAMLSSRFSQGTARIYSADYDLPMLDWRIVNVLHWYGPMSANAIAQRIAVDKGNVCRAVARLEHRRLILREPDPSDQRVVNQSLTDAGERLFQQINPIARHREEKLLSVLTDAERCVLDDMLNRLIGLLDQLG